MATPNALTPMGFVEALPSPIQAWVKPGGTVRTMPDQPPASRRPRYTSGAKPATIRKNWSTSL